MSEPAPDQQPTARDRDFATKREEYAHLTGEERQAFFRHRRSGELKAQLVDHDHETALGENQSRGASPEARRLQELYAAAPDSVQEDMTSQAENDAWRIYGEAEDLVSEEALSMTRKKIAETEKGGAEWTPEMISTEEQETIEAFGEPLAGDLDQAVGEFEKEKEAISKSRLDQERLTPLLDRKPEVLELLARQYTAKGQRPQQVEYDKARQRYLDIIRTGKYSGKTTDKGADRSFKQYAKQSWDRVKKTSANYPGIVRKLFMVPTRIAAETVGFGLFAVGKTIQRSTNGYRLNRLLKNARDLRQ